MAYFIMVLADGETFTALDGCKIVEVPDDYETYEIECALAEGDAKTTTVAKFTDQNGQITVHKHPHTPMGLRLAD